MGSLGQNKKQYRSNLSLSTDGKDMTAHVSTIFYVLSVCIFTFITAVYATGMTAVVDQSASLHCRAYISARRINGIVTLIRWFHSSIHRPLYTLDVRSLNTSLSTYPSIIHKGRHFPSPETEGRFYLDLSLNPIALRIDPVKSEDTGIYKCQIEFKHKRSVQSIIHLDVIVPPKEAIIRNTKGMKVEGIVGPLYIGQDLDLTCDSVEGYPRPLANWKCNIVEDHRLIKNGSDLTIHSLNRQDQWSHCTCTVQNTNMTAPKSVTVILELVLPPTELLLYSNIHRPFISGENAQISCQSFGSYPRAHVVWKKDGESLKSDERITDNGNVTTSFIEFMAQNSDDGMEMQCIAFNPDMKNYILRRSFIMKVHYKPEVQIVMLSNQSQASEGHNLVLLCNVKANPKVDTVVWTFQNKEIAINTSISIIEKTLYIKSLELSHNGQFCCAAENEMGEANDSVMITVKRKPQCMEIDINYSQISSEVNVTCILDAHPNDVNYYWTRRNSTSNSSWTTGKVSHTRLILHETSSEVFCWGINEIGVQTSPCRLLLSKSSVHKTSILQDLLISLLGVIICCVIITSLLKKYKNTRSSLFLKHEEAIAKGSFGRIISNCAEPSINSNESDSSIMPLNNLK